MNKKLLEDSGKIITYSIQRVLPNTAVINALRDFKRSSGKLILIAIGKAAWPMAASAVERLGNVDAGIVLTKYGHVFGEIPNVTCLEAGHPIPDDNSFEGTRKILLLVRDLNEDDTVLFLVSGGGSAIFELPMIEGDEVRNITEQLLASGANINEINCIRKHLSMVKGGRFAESCRPANIFQIILSDVLGDYPDVIASGPAYPDSSTKEDALAIIEKYNIILSKEALNALSKETPKNLDNIETHITGSVKELCKAAADICKTLGYNPIILTDQLTGEAKEAGVHLAKKAVEIYNSPHMPTALIEGGETVVHITGSGMGGRNQELALSAAKLISRKNICVFSIGSDGTDGPTDAAGGIVDGDSYYALADKAIHVNKVFEDNDSYNALKAINGLLITGPTGTNVNDLSLALIP